MSEELYNILEMMKRIGEDLPNFSEYDVIMNKCPLIIKEGLIKTQPTSLTVDSLKINFNLFDDNDKNVGNNYNGKIKVISINEKSEVIVITLFNNDIITKIKEKCLVYGWINYRTEDNKYYFEKRFGDRFSASQLLNMTKKIYHITSSTLINKIKKEGLIPKESKTLGFENEPRIYFRLDIPSKEQAHELNLMKFNFAPPAVFEIDVNKLNKNQSFFYDSRWLNSIFTFEPIPINAIRLMEQNELLDIKLI